MSKKLSTSSSDDEGAEEQPAIKPAPADDEEDALSEDERHQWMLGFVEPPLAAADLLRHRFPSKVGGRPAWLDPVRLPSKDQLTCGASGRLLQFLLQVYAPVDSVPHAFHRSLYVFVTPEGDKVTRPGAVRALRCQLPRANDFYPPTPPSAADVAPPELGAEQLAAVAGCDPWRVAESEQATARARPPPPPSQPIHVFPEAELVVEEEGDVMEEEEEKMQKVLSDYAARVAAEGELDGEELPDELVDDVEGKLAHEQKVFADFQTRISVAPEQVLRYCFDDGAAPLWPSASPVPPPASSSGGGDIPPCPNCGAPRRFEFQILPQLLNYLELNHEDSCSLDWGTIAVYSCSASCSPQPSAAADASLPQGACPQPATAYLEEYVFVQPTT